MEHGLHIEGHHPLEGLLVMLRKWYAPSGTGVVDEYVKGVFALRDVIGKPAALLLRGKVGRYRDACPSL